MWLGLLVAAALSATCATPPPLPQAETARGDAATARPPARTPTDRNASDAATTGGAADAPPDPPRTAAPDGRYVARDGSTSTYAGLRVGAAGETAFLVVTRASSAAGAADRFLVTESVRSGPDPGALGPARTLRHELVVTPDAVRVTVAPDGPHARPDPVVELPLPPKPGTRWSVRNRFVAVDCEVLRTEPAVTFDGPLPHCALVELRAADGARVTRRWYHPREGLVRSETRDARGRLTYALARHAGALPDAATIRALFDVAR